jgi:ubiquinone/menaquinone biosynthesis C-methylase UbiE
MATTTDKWQSGDAYERYMGRWSRQLAPRFLRWLDVAPARRWLDVGCGTGALCSAILERCAPSALTGVDPSAGFLATARSRLPDHVELRQAPAAALPLADAAVDVTVSALVLNFVPDAAAALREMVRVTVPGGVVAGCVWSYADRMELIRSY